MKSDAITVTTALIVAFALFVIYTRFKNWLDSNVPIFFYVILIAFMKSVDGTVPLWLMLTAFALGLVLRFEFMNVTFAPHGRLTFATPYWAWNPHAVLPPSLYQEATLRLNTASSSVRPLDSMSSRINCKSAGETEDSHLWPSRRWRFMAGRKKRRSFTGT